MFLKDSPFQNNGAGKLVLSFQSSGKRGQAYVRSPEIFGIYMCNFPELGTVHATSAHRPMVCVGYYTDQNGTPVALDMMSLTTRNVRDNTRYDVPIAHQKLEGLSQKKTRIATDTIFTIPNSHDRILSWKKIGDLSMSHAADLMLRRALSVYEQTNNWHRCTNLFERTERHGLMFDRLDDKYILRHFNIPDVLGEEVPFKPVDDNIWAKKGLSWRESCMIQELATELHVEKLYGHDARVPQTGIYPHWPQLAAIKKTSDRHMSY